MLEKLLSRADCAECKLCCGFYESEIWEAPITGNVTYDESGIYFCPELGESGCKLGDGKPFECRLWPFRLMRLNGYKVIALSPLCKKVNEKPLAELTRFVGEEFSDILKEREPLMEYRSGYTILKVMSSEPV